MRINHEFLGLQMSTVCQMSGKHSVNLCISAGWLNPLPNFKKRGGGLA